MGCWMGWPESDDSKYLWREGGELAHQAYANVAKAISQFEQLFMIANRGKPAANARRVFSDSPNVTVEEIPINDGWTRDWGPSVSPLHPLTASLGWYLVISGVMQSKCQHIEWPLLPVWPQHSLFYLF